VPELEKEMETIKREIKASFTIILVSLSPAVCIYSFSAEQLTGFLAIIGAVCLPISFTVVTVSFLPDLIFFESVKSCYLISSLPFQFFPKIEEFGFSFFDLQNN